VSYYSCEHTSFPLDASRAYCQCECTDLKEQRLQIRIDPATKNRLELAAAASRQTVSSFVLQAAEARAHAVLADPGVIQLPQPPETSGEALGPFSPEGQEPVRVLRAPKRHPKRDAKRDAKRSKTKDHKSHKNKKKNQLG
jgi:hypothetical protein